MSTKAAKRPEWDGLTVVCLASGPSLTAEDCELARLSGYPTIVTNTTFRIAPWAHLLFGFDTRWWVNHMDEIKGTFSGRLMSVSEVAPNFGVETTFGSTWFVRLGNSGACAITLAIGAGAKRVILLGFDCGFSIDGKKHWHPDHPKGMTNGLSVKKWPQEFKKAAEIAKKADVKVLNASRATTLRCFERVQPEQVL